MLIYTFAFQQIDDELFNPDYVEIDRIMDISHSKDDNGEVREPDTDVHLWSSLYFWSSSVFMKFCSNRGHAFFEVYNRQISILVPEIDMLYLLLLVQVMYMVHTINPILYLKVLSLVKIFSFLSIYFI